MTRAGVRAFIHRSAVVARSIYDQVVTIGGNDYPAAVAPASKRSVIDQGGERLISEISVRIEKRILANPPPSQSLLLWKGKRYQVETVSDNDLDSDHYIQCYEYDG